MIISMVPAMVPAKPRLVRGFRLPGEVAMGDVVSRSLHRSGYTWQRKIRPRVFATYGTTCWICGHDGSTDVDHLVPLSVDPDQPLEVDGMRPAHGVTGCPTCSRRCNQERGNRMNFTMFRPRHDW